MKGKFVLVYVDSITRYELAVIKEELSGNRVRILTMEGTELVRHLEINYKEIKDNGNAYLLKAGKCRLCNRSVEGR